MTANYNADIRLDLKQGDMSHTHISMEDIIWVSIKIWKRSRVVILISWFDNCIKVIWKNILVFNKYILKTLG